MPLLRLRFVAESGLGDALILWSEDALGWRFGYTHVGAIRVVDGRELEFGARHGVDGSLAGRPGVQYRPADYARFRRVGYVELPITEAQEAALWAYADLALLGRPYSDRGVLGFALGTGWRDSRGLVCSQAVALLLDSIGLLPDELKGQEDRLDPEAVWYLALGIREGAVQSKRASE